MPYWIAMSYPLPSECLPHEPPMVLLHQIEWVKNDQLCAVVYLRESDIVHSSSGVAVAWALEIIAQAAAAFIGIHHASDGYTTGRLIRASSFKAKTDTLPLDAKLVVTVSKIAESEMGVFLFQGSLVDDDCLLAEAALTILAK